MVNIFKKPKIFEETGGLYFMILISSKKNDHMKYLIRSLFALCCLLCRTKAASFSFDFQGNNVVSRPHQYYVDRYLQPDGTSLDTTSRVYRSESTFAGNGSSVRLTAEMSGHHYDSDPRAGSVWGLLDTSSTNFTETPDAFNSFVIKYGIRPNALGSTVSNLLDKNGNPANASYLQFSLFSDQDVVFDTLSLDIEDLSAIEPTNLVWAKIDIDDRARIVRPLILRDEETETISLRFDWDNLSLDDANSGPATVQIYGLKGSDYGTFRKATLSGVIPPPIDPTPVPEAGSSLLALVATVLAAGRRRRAVIS
jgi:hypothetical protein